MNSTNQGSGNWLARFCGGEHRAVWTELLAQTPVSEEEAWAVATETMGRVRRNLEAIVERLGATGYVFADTNMGSDEPIRPLTTPGEEYSDLANWLNTTLGPIPISLRAFLTCVGDVNLLGYHSNWPSDLVWRLNGNFYYVDPFVCEFRWEQHGSLEKTKQHFLNERDEWQRHADEFGEAGPCRIDFAPDPVHKAGYSGGGPYGILVPDGRADGMVDLDGEKFFFVDYLRRAILDYGSLFGFRHMPEGSDGGLVAYLTADLEPF